MYQAFLYVAVSVYQAFLVVDNSYVSLPYLLVTLTTTPRYSIVLYAIGSYRVVSLVSHVVVATMCTMDTKPLPSRFKRFYGD